MRLTQLGVLSARSKCTQTPPSKRPLEKNASEGALKYAPSKLPRS